MFADLCIHSGTAAAAQLQQLCLHSWRPEHRVMLACTCILQRQTNFMQDAMAGTPAFLGQLALRFTKNVLAWRQLVTCLARSCDPNQPRLN